MILGIRPNIVPKLPQSKNNQPNYASNVSYNAANNPLAFGMTNGSSQIKHLKDLKWYDWSVKDLQVLIERMFNQANHKFTLKEMELLASDERVLNDLSLSKRIRIEPQRVSVGRRPDSIYNYIITDVNNYGIKKALIYNEKGGLEGFEILNGVTEEPLKTFTCFPDGPIGVWSDYEKGKEYILDRLGNVIETRDIEKVLKSQK